MSATVHGHERERKRLTEELDSTEEARAEDCSAVDCLSFWRRVSGRSTTDFAVLSAAFFTMLTEDCGLGKDGDVEEYLS